VTALAVREHHRFEAAGRQFVYLVPSAAVFALDIAADAVMRLLECGPLTAEDIVRALAPTFGAAQVETTVDELASVMAIGTETAPPEPPSRVIPLVPLTTMVLNVTNQCNLSCTYCYEYGADKIVDTANGKQPKFMTEETAREAVEFMLKESGASPVAYLTFFGGETLMNFPVLKRTVGYARERAAACGKQVHFSLTTNATLLRPEIIEFLADHDIGVTVSIDGPQDIQDRFRVFQNGRGSYDLVAPKIEQLLRRHTTRPIGARVTLASGTVDVKRIYRHLTEELGFSEVGFAPATSAATRDHAIPQAGYEEMLAQFQELADEFLEYSVAGRYHGFSNVRETLEEIHKGMNKAFPCGAGLGLMGVSTGGDVALCHRFAGSDDHRLGSVRDGVDRDAQRTFLEKHHVDAKTDCRTCWARPLCSGGCYHEAHTRYGDTARPNLHYCDWIRGWTDVCLRVYGALAERNPAFLAQFDREPMGEDVA
jgi:uncharacterized protein